jgi:hypothetical protein
LSNYLRKKFNIKIEVVHTEAEFWPTNVTTESR